MVFLTDFSIFLRAFLSNQIFCLGCEAIQTIKTQIYFEA